MARSVPLEEHIALLGGVVSNDFAKRTQLIQVFRAPTLADLGDDTQEANEDQAEKPHSDTLPCSGDGKVASLATTGNPN